MLHLLTSAPGHPLSSSGVPATHDFRLEPASRRTRGERNRDRLMSFRSFIGCFGPIASESRFLFGAAHSSLQPIPQSRASPQSPLRGGETIIRRERAAVITKSCFRALGTRSTVPLVSTRTRTSRFRPRTRTRPTRWPGLICGPSRSFSLFPRLKRIATSASNSWMLTHSTLPTWVAEPPEMAVGHS